MPDIFFYILWSVFCLTILYTLLFKRAKKLNSINYNSDLKHNKLLVLYNILDKILINNSYLVSISKTKRFNESAKQATKFIYKTINKLNYLNIINKLNKNLVNINNFFLENLQNKFKISFSASNIVKYLSDISISKSTILFLRKNKVFNKSRYSRNRQTYRTGAYWCLYINIIAVIAFYFWFYNFTMNFGYVWWLLYAFILSFVLFKAIKFKFYNIRFLYLELIDSIRWLYTILFNIFKQILYYLVNILKLNKINFLVNGCTPFKILYKLTKATFLHLANLNNYIYNKII